MAKKYYEGEINMNTDWGAAGDEKLPVSGERVQKFIKDTLNSKMGYVGLNETSGMYVLTKDFETFESYLDTITSENPKGDESMTLGMFRAPYEYSASVSVLDPESGYKVILSGEKNTTIKFKGETKGGDGSLVEESYTYKITFRNGGTSNTVNGFLSIGETKEINVDKFIFNGSNTVTINITGRDTGVSAFKTIEVKVVELSLEDSFNIASFYDVSKENKTLTVNYKASSNGKAKIRWFIDYIEKDSTTGSGTNTENGVKNIQIEKGMTQGVHSLIFYLECEDQTTSDVFRTPIYYRNFFVYTGEEITAPMISMSFTVPCETAEDYNRFIAEKRQPNVYNVKQYDVLNLYFSVYYEAISTPAEIMVLEPEASEYRVDANVTTTNGNVYKHAFNVKKQGLTTVKIVAGGSEYVVGPFDVSESDMNIEPVEDNLVLYFDAAGRTNDDKEHIDEWTYTDFEGKEIKVQFNNFQWTTANGWNDNKLVIARNTSIDIPFQPFVNTERIQAGATFEFEFNTKNVYDDNAPICSILDPKGYPGIVITASEAKFIIKKSSQEGAQDVAVSTKFKAGENNRISFVITPRGTESNRDRFVKVYVNGIICGAVVYDYTADFYNTSTIHIEGTDKAEIELNSLRFYSAALNNDEILDNYIFFRNDTTEKTNLYNKNNIYSEGTEIDIDVVKEQLPVMIFYQRQLSDGSTEGKIEDIETEFIDKKKTVYFDIEFINTQNPTYNFSVTRARVRPQGTSSMKYPKKNFRFYTDEEDDTVLLDYEGKVIEDRKYSFKDKAAPVSCWCLKADFAESSGTHNTGTARYWNAVLKEANILTKAQKKAIDTKYEYDVRTTIDGYPIVLFYKEVSADKPRFIGKYNFNNDKSTEDVFGFTGGPTVENQEVKYFEIGTSAPQVNKDGKKKGADKIGEYTPNPTEDSALFAKDENGKYYMLRGKELFDNPKMECWEMLDSASRVALFKTVEGFGIGDDDEKVGRYYESVGADGTVATVWEEAFESRFPDCGKYFNTNELYRFCSWMVDCLYLKIDENGNTVNMTDEELYEMSKQTTLTIQSVSQYPGLDEFRFDPKDTGETPTNYWEQHILPNTAENRKLKFRIEKYDHIDMDKMAAYYIYLMRFGGVDQTVKNAMFTTEGSRDENHPEWPSLWYFINYDNDTILGVKNDGHLIHDPYISRTSYEPGTKTFAYAGRESTLWNNLENDNEFMDLVHTVDAKLHESVNGLSYANAIDMYNNQQSAQWSERIYNMDAQYKYIDSYVNPIKSETSAEAETDYLFDVQGSRSAHRKWWLSKRFNIYDSKFITGDFLGSDIILKVNDLDKTCQIEIVSGEDIYYAIGANNSAYYITPTTVKNGEKAYLPVMEKTQIGTPISIYGSPNIESLDLRSLSHKLGQLELAKANSASIGTKLKTLLVGDNENPIISVLFTTLSGLGTLEKLETLDFTGMAGQSSLSELYKLKNLKNLYLAGTNISSILFNEGGNVSKIEAPSSLNTLVLNEISTMTFDDLKFYDVVEENGVVSKVENENYGGLMALTLKNSPKLSNDYDFILSWLEKREEMGELLESYTLILDEIDWTIPADELDRLWILKRVNGSRNGTVDIRGKITVDKKLTYEEAKNFIDIFGEKCFEKNAVVEVNAQPGVFIIGDETILEGNANETKYKVIKVGMIEGTTGLSIREVVSEYGGTGEIGSGVYFRSNEDRTEAYVKVDEVKRKMFGLQIEVTFTSYDFSVNLTSPLRIGVEKRKYPTIGEIYNAQNQYTISIKGAPYDYSLILSDNEGNSSFNGIFNVEWSMSGEAYTNGYVIFEKTSEKGCTIVSNELYNSTFKLKAKFTRTVEGEVINFLNVERDMGIKDTDVLMIPADNPAVYWTLFDKGVIGDKEKLRKSDALTITEAQIGTAFKGVTEVTHEGVKYTFNNFDQLEFFGIRNLVADMFSGCTNLTSIKLPDNGAFESIGDRALAGTKLRTINLPSTLKSIGDNAMSSMSNLTELVVPDSVVHIGKQAFYNNIYLKKLTLGKNVTVIPERAFADCERLETLMVLGDVTTIGKLAFNACKMLKLLKLSDKIDSITFDEETSPFASCGVIKFEGGNEKYEVKNGSLYFNDTNKKWLVKYNTENTEFDSDVLYLASYSLCGLKIDDVIIPNNFILAGSNILYGAVGNTIKLSNVFAASDYCKGIFANTQYNTYTFANGETTIPESCFQDCKQITAGINLPNTIITINKSAFNGCENISTLTIPSSVKTIGTDALTNMKRLSIVYMQPTTPPSLNGDMFKGVGWLTLSVDGNVYTDYTTQWKQYTPYIEMNSLPDRGFFRIIENGNVYFSDVIGSTVSDITVGNLSVKQSYSGYYEFVNNTGSPVKNFSIKRNGTIIGEFRKNNMTLYLGDNMSLYSGKGIDFTRGIVTSTKLEQMGVITYNEGWDYNKRVEGWRNPYPMQENNGNAKVTLNLTDYAENGTVTFKFGQLSEYGYDYANFYSNGKLIDGVLVDGKTPTTKGTFKGITTLESTAKVPATTFDIVYAKDGSNSYFVDGMWISSIGNPVYTDPALPGEYSINLIVNVYAENGKTNVFNGRKVRITNGGSFDNVYTLTSNKLQVQLPKNDTYTITSDSFMVGNKFYEAPGVKEITNVSADVNIDYTFKTVSEGVYAVDKDGNLSQIVDDPTKYVGLLYSTDDTDMFINKNVQNIQWANLSSDSKGMRYTEESNLLISNTNGYNNTTNIREFANNSTNVLLELDKITDLKAKVDWFIPSYYELLSLAAIEDVNNMMTSLQMRSFNGIQLWTSNMPDGSNAWTMTYSLSSGTDTALSVSRSSKKDIMFFGKFKI